MIKSGRQTGKYGFVKFTAIIQVHSWYIASTLYYKYNC